MVAYRVWVGVVFLAWLGGPFLAAGRAGWLEGWAYFAALAAALVLHRRYVAGRNPELLRRREKMGEGTRRWDIAWNVGFWPLMASVAIVAGFDERRGWMPMTGWLWLAGLLLLAGGFGLSAWAMAVNPHFEGTVRIQKERDHRVIDVGPYRRVRHPGYVGLALWALGTPFLLLSWSAFVPAFSVVGWIALRTALEDRTLRDELSGYRDYASRVRFRLVPGLW